MGDELYDVNLEDLTSLIPTSSHRIQHHTPRNLRGDEHSYRPRGPASMPITFPFSRYNAGYLEPGTGPECFPHCQEQLIYGTDLAGCRGQKFSDTDLCHRTLNLNITPRGSSQP